MKKIFYCLFYSLAVVMLPAWIGFFTLFGEKYNQLQHYLLLYIYFVSPLLFIPFFIKAKLKNWKERLLFILFGFVLPFSLIGYWSVLEYKENFHPF